MRCTSLFVVLPFVTPFAQAQAPRPLPGLAEATRIVATADGAALSWSELLDRLATFDVVFLGETHVDDTTHRVELYVLEQLLARRHGKVVLSMEMFERNVQPALDDYLAGRIEEAAFLGKARPWQNYRTAYRPLVEAAKAAKVPVVAANFPGTLRRKLGGDDAKAAIDALPPDQRALMPDTIFPASESYWQRVDRAVRGHMGMTGGGTPEERQYETQNLWDNAMGDNVARARAAHGDSLVLHIAGGFHVAYRDGTVAQFARRSPGSTFAVVSIAPALELHGVRPDRDRDQADFLVYAEALAREFHDGNYAVSVPAELRYRLEVPAHGKDLPLLVWVPDRTTRTDDAVARWQAVLGDDAALAVIEAPFPELQDDLAVGGRYAFGDGFRADYGRVSYGLARLVEYVTRRFPVAGNRVLIAGAGDGGAAVLWTALYGEWLEAEFAAIDPSDLKRLSMEALPDQPPVARSLQLFAVRGDAKQLAGVATDCKQAGAKVDVATLADANAFVDQARSRLGLSPRAPLADAEAPLLLVLRQDLLRAREWAALHVDALRRQGKSARVVRAEDVPVDTPAGRRHELAIGGDGHWSVASFGSGFGLPLAGGPFGGTTVVVLPAATSDSDRAAWLELEQKKVLKRRSPFANVAIATMDGELALPRVLAKLRGMGRSRVLIVPAMFCADAATMRSLRDSLDEPARAMDVSWLPGLGAELAHGAGH